MPSAHRRLAANAPGDLFVDDSCIDCGTCRWMAPESFDAVGDQSRVHTQPTDALARRRAHRALVACPTTSIGTATRAEAAAAIADFPLPFAPDVLHCGFHAASSYGAASWLLLRPGGNVLIDSPRFNAPLVRRIEALGGVRWMFLTHRDDVADHQKFRDHFGCERIIHRAEASATGPVERWVDGDATVLLDDDLEIIPTPGHTRGSACLRYRDEVLFSGDTLAWSPMRGHVIAFRDACWYDWTVLQRSVARLADHPFSWLLPGHGAPVHLRADEMRQSLERCRGWMRG